MVERRWRRFWQKKRSPKHAGAPPASQPYSAGVDGSAIASVHNAEALIQEIDSGFPNARSSPQPWPAEVGSGMDSQGPDAKGNDNELDVSNDTETAKSNEKDRPGWSAFPGLGKVADHDIRAATKQTKIGLSTFYQPRHGTPILDVVFVHGLTGDPLETWRHVSTRIHWPIDLLHRDISDAHILSFGYDADVVKWWSPSSDNRVGNHAETLLGDLTRHQERENSERRKIIFVMHSLGGLVVQNALSLSRQSLDHHLSRLYENTVGLVFLGTPHFGSDLASWGKLAASLVNIVKPANKAIVQTLERNSETLASIQKGFHEVLRRRAIVSKPINVTCFYEELPVSSIRQCVVPKQSAILPSYPSYGIHANHMDMPRFRDTEESGYQRIVGEIQRWAKNVRDGPLHNTALQEECLRSLYFEHLEDRQENVTPALDGTFNWIWSHDECSFPLWLRDGPGLYLVSGKAGTGKSTLFKFIHHTALDNAPQSPDPLIIAYFIDHRCSNPVSQSFTGILRAFLWNILRQNPRLFEIILPKYSELKRGRPLVSWKLSDLKAGLLEIVANTSARSTFWLLDALDESSDDPVQIAGFLAEVSAKAPERVRICISSRPEPWIACFYQLHSSLIIEEHTKLDIHKYTLSVTNPLKELVDHEHAQEMVQAISHGAKGLFLWARIVSEDVVRRSWRGSRVDQLLESLKELPQELDVLYHRLLDSTLDRSEAELALGIAAAACRSLSLPEFQYVLDKYVSDRSHKENGTFQRRLNALCRSLLESKSGIVELSHETVLAFVRALPDRDTENRQLNPIFRGHERLAIDCLLLLQKFFREHADHLCAPQAFTEDQDVLKELRSYAISNWVRHCAAAKLETCVNLSLPQLSNKDFSSWRRLFLAQYWQSPDLESFWISVHPLQTLLELIMLSLLRFDLRQHTTEFMESSVPEHAAEPAGLSDAIPTYFNLDLGAGASVSLQVEQVLSIRLAAETVLQCAITPHYENDDTSCFASYTETTYPRRQALWRMCQRELIPETAGIFRFAVKRGVIHELQTVLRHGLQLNLGDSYVTPQNSFPKYNVDRLWPGESNERFATPVHYAAFYGLNHLIKMLYLDGANLDYVSKEACYGTALISAVFGLYELGDELGDKNAIGVLLQCGANLEVSGNAAGLGIVTPLSAAIRLFLKYKHRVGKPHPKMMEIIQLLTEQGATVDLKTRAIAISSVELKKYLSALGPDLAFSESYGLKSEFASSARSASSFKSLPKEMMKSRYSHSVGVLPSSRARSSTLTSGARLMQTVQEAVLEIPESYGHGQRDEGETPDEDPELFQPTVLRPLAEHPLFRLAPTGADTNRPENDVFQNWNPLVLNQSLH